MGCLRLAATETFQYLITYYGKYPQSIRIDILRN
jgi:hypothetical protein